LTPEWHEACRGRRIPPRFGIPARFDPLYPVAFKAESAEHIQTFRAGGASAGRESEAGGLYRTAAYLSTISNSLVALGKKCEALEVLAATLSAVQEGVREVRWAMSDEFACEDLRRWMMAGFCRRAGAADLEEIRRRGRVSPTFVTTAASKSRLVIDYTVVNECMEERTFRMDQLSDLAPTLRRDDCMFKADIKDAYYHLRLRKEDEIYLSFSVGGVV
jgi:hypothetical protein